MNNFCGRVNCNYAHVVPGTMDTVQNTYIVLNKKNQLNIRMQVAQDEKLISSSSGKVQGVEAIVALSSKNRLFIIDLNNFKL